VEKMDIITLKTDDLQAVLHLLKAVTKDLQSEGIRQWDRFYPNRFVVKRDLASGSIYGFHDADQIIAAVTIDVTQSNQYKQIVWKDSAGSPAIIHRLAVHPEAQGKGLGKRLIQFAEQTARQRGHSSIRLDVYSGNPKAIGLYVHFGYEQRGKITFPFRKRPYLCMEKVF
jgi:GNAT superfamily N-acetyltransferase